MSSSYNMQLTIIGLLFVYFNQYNPQVDMHEQIITPT